MKPWNPDYSWMDEITVEAPAPYSVRRRRFLNRMIFACLSLCSICVGVIVAVYG